MSSLFFIIVTMQGQIHWGGGGGGGGGEGVVICAQGVQFDHFVTIFSEFPMNMK